MKAISLWQPWASAMALGHKSIETRHWSTRYRGPLLIHASKRFDRDEREVAEELGLVPADLPLGAIVAVGILDRIVPTETLRSEVTPAEREWGNYADGRFGWVFRNVHAMERPIPFRGAQGFFEVPDALLGAWPALLADKVLL